MTSPAQPPSPRRQIKKLTMDLTVEQVKMLHEAAGKQTATTAGPEQVRWQAILRETRRALDYYRKRSLDVDAGFDEG